MNILYILLYKTVNNFTELRQPYREQHLKLIQKAYKDGKIKMAGALDEPADTALLVFNEKQEAKEFAEKDPYVIKGLVKEWSVRPWNVVVGA